jgi:hypothetical protein
MKSRASSLLVALAGIAVVATIVASPAEAALARRTWRATLGGSSGSVVLTVNTDSTGTITTAAQGMKPSTTYAQLIYQGTCAQPKAVVRLGGLLTDATGTGSRTIRLSSRQGGAIWTAETAGSIAIRVGTAADAHCAVLRYPVATRIVIAAKSIDLPIVVQRGGAFPYCNVAMYLAFMSQPGERGPTFIYAHARTGMFLPLLTASQANNGAAMIGMKVQVWRSDNLLYTYQVTQVRRHVYTFPNYDPTVEQLWLQTSEGPVGTYNKLFVIAKRIRVESASDAAAHPTPHPLVCH